MTFRIAIVAVLIVFILAPIALTAQSWQPQVLRIDTLGPAGLRSTDPACATLTINCATPSCKKGYVTGNNLHGLREVLMKYRFTGPGTVLSAFVKTGRKKMENAASETFAVYYPVGPDGYPDMTSRRLSQPVTMSTLRDGAYQQFSFDSALAFADSFFIGFVLPVTIGDTIAVFQTPNHSASPCAALHDTLAYERYTDGHFSRTYEYWQTVFELAIKVEIEYDYVAVRTPLANRIKVYPIPAKGVVQVNLPEGLQARQWKLAAPDGRTTIGTSPAPGSSLIIDRKGLPAGLYQLRIETVAGWLGRTILFAD